MAETKREDAAAYVILDSALNGKGVSAQTNPMEKPEDEAKAVFDELSKDIIIPAFNRFVLFMAAQLGMIDMTKDADKPISAAMQTALDKKQDREKRTGSETLYKVLTDNNFTDAAAEQLAAAFAALHEHANKTLLDGLTQTDIDNWNGANVLTKDNMEPYEPRGEYQPATVRFVLDRVVAIGAADMQARIYDPQNRQADIFGEMDKTAAALRKEMAAAWENARYIIDDVTGEKYRLGVSGGGLYYRKEAEAWAIRFLLQGRTRWSRRFCRHTGFRNTSFSGRKATPFRTRRFGRSSA